MSNKSPDPREVIVTFRVTPGERAKIDQFRGNRSVADFIRGLIFGGGR